MRKKLVLIVLLTTFASLFFLCAYRLGSQYLTFSDAAKFADVARNLVDNKGYGSNFSFYGQRIFENLEEPLFSESGILPAMPFSIAAFFKTFGVSDFAVISTSSFFYILLIIFSVLLGRKLFGNLVGILAGTAIATNLNILDYAASGASETLFMLEIVLAAYLFILRKRWTSVIGVLALVLMYFTRPQAIIYIFGLLLLFFIINLTLKKALTYFVVVFLAGSLMVLSSRQGTFAITQHLPGIASSDALRGASQEFTALGLFKKVFYNLYNFYKLLPQIINPYLFAFFAVSIFKWGKSKPENSFKIASIFMVALTFLITALTIPFFRYIHPIIPLVYIIAVATIVGIFNSLFAVSNKFSIPTFKITKQRLVGLASSFLILLLAAGQTLGVIFLDSRFEAKMFNRGMPPIYVEFSYILRENTEEDDVVVTNLDTWGTWYGERKTVWFPLEPEMLENPETGEVPFDAIYLTSYLIDDENYYMGEAWREVFLNPESHSNEFIKENFEFTNEFEVSADETFERQPVRAVLFVKR